jgi:hypothetical protein
MLRINNGITAEGANFHSPFNDDVLHVRQVPINASVLTSAEVTAGGFLKPGVPLTVGATLAALVAGIAAGTARILVATGGVVEGVTIEAVKIAKSNSGTDLTAAGTVQATIGTVGAVSRKRIEEMLGRVLTAAEIAGFGPSNAGSQVMLER